VVLANFVVSHFTHYDVALVDMVRVLRRGGQLGVTAWGPSQSVYSEVWREVAGSFVSKDLLLDASRQGVPWAWEEWFSEPIHVREALQDAGLIKVKVRRREYRTVMSVAAYLIARETSLQGRFMRQTLTKAQWKHFQESAAEEFRSRFGDSIRYTGEVHLAVSTRP
jgi:hypothetical protein